MEKRIIATIAALILLTAATNATAQQSTQQLDPQQPSPGMRGPGMMGHGGMMGGGMMGSGMMRQGGTTGTLMRIIFGLMDSDGDGTISLQEFQAAHERIFKAMDANKDGVLTLEEMQSFMAGHRRLGPQQ